MIRSLVRSRHFVSTYLVFLALTTTTAWVVANPPRLEEFVSLSVLSRDLTGTGFFSDNTSTVRTGELVAWNIQVYNHMGTTQLMLVDVKLSNETLPGPDAKTNSPSYGVSLFQIVDAVLSNQTWNMPLQWSILDQTQNGAVVIQSMQVNNQTVSGLDVSATSGKNFRIVVELWTYDVQTHSFLYSLRSNGEIRSVWVQLWFNV